MDTATDTNPKTSFQQISTQMESLLELYKSHYPKNFGDTIKRRLGLVILILSVCAVIGGFFSANHVVSIFAMFAAPGMVTFALVMLLTETRRKDLSRNLLNKIGVLQVQLEPLSVFPDVKKYCDSFAQRLTRASDYKKRLRSIFKTCFIIFLSTCVVALFLVLYRFVSLGNGWQKHTSDTKDPFVVQNTAYVSDQVHLDSNLICTLLPMPNGFSDDNPALKFYLSPEDFLVSANLTDVFVPYYDAHYVLFITDVYGVPVPRAPTIVFEGDDSEAFFYFRTDGNLDLVRIIKYLKENQNNLRYNIEILDNFEHFFVE